MPHLDFIDLMKSDDFEKGGSNADEYQNMKNTKADETQKFYKMFWILKIVDWNIADKRSISVPF